MAKPSGRIEKGQKLSTAISARAWNRAQDAADIVLDQGPLFRAGEGRPWQFALVAPVKLASAAEEVWDPGTAITITGWYPEDSPSRKIQHLTGEVMQPKALSTYETHSTVFPVPFAVTVDYIREGATVARCAISGLVIASIRVISTQHRYISVATDRTAAGGTAGEAGVLETSDMGYAKLLKTSTIAAGKTVGLVLL